MLEKQQMEIIKIKMYTVIQEADCFIKRMESLEESSSGETVNDRVENQILHDLVNAREDIAAHLWELDDYFLQLKKPIAGQ